MSVRLGRLNPAFGSSRSASSAYQKWPTWHLAFHAQAPSQRAGLLAHLKFESRLRSFRPQGLQSFALPDKTACVRAPAILRETSEGTSY
ncbi:hypothetical protein QQF64_034519 [Cirrhinus molitorella]|uniref:Uncharacterized protein n=1 Tax=Cirrhinus molitorella TaxID=172907 RepID=A0ABR3L2S4_9TELE